MDRSARLTRLLPYSSAPNSKLVNSLEGVSGSLLREQRPIITLRYKDGVLWSPAYFAGSCGGAPLAAIAASIRNQREAAPPARPEGRLARKLR